MPPKQPPPPTPLTPSPTPPETTYFHQNPHPLYTPLLTSTSSPPFVYSHTLSTNPRIKNRDPYFSLSTNPQFSAVHETLFLSRRTPVPTGHLLLHVGPGVNGQPGIAHGGFLATVLDEVCGTLIASTGLDEGRGMFTVHLGIGYRRAVVVPESVADGEGKGVGKGKGTVIMATARLSRVEGRKVFIDGEIRDMSGEVCTTVEAIFVKKKEAVL